MLSGPRPQCGCIPPLPPCSGADRAALNADGKTALEVAQLNEQEDVIKALS